MKSAFRKAWPAILLLATTVFSPTAAHAQVWLPDPGRGSLYVGYEYANAHWTLLPQEMTGVVFGPYSGGPGNKFFQGEHYGQHVTLDMDYGVRRGLAVTAHLAYVGSKYSGELPHANLVGPIVEDDGGLHGSFQDAELGVRQTVLSTPFVITPFVAYLIPLQPYATYAHAAMGHHLRELRLGAALGRDLRPLLSDAYGSMTYAYSAAERQDEHSIHRNSLDMELGYFVTEKLSLKGAASWMRSSGGIEWVVSSSGGVLSFGEDYANHFFSHDALANERSWRVGGGAGYTLTPGYQLYVLGFATVWGANTHAMNTFAAGIGWNFATPWAR